MSATKVLLTPKAQLKQMFTCLYNDGLLDRQFERLRGLQNDANPGFIVDLLTVFCEESHSICSEIDQLSNRLPLDYHRIVARVHQLKGCCSSIGGRRVNGYCEEVQIAYEKNDTYGITQALNGIKNECFRLQIHFQTVIELERKILENSTA